MNIKHTQDTLWSRLTTGWASEVFQHQESHEEKAKGTFRAPWFQSWFEGKEGGDDAFTALRGSISRESKQDKTDDLGDRGGWNRQPPADRITYK